MEEQTDHDKMKSPVLHLKTTSLDQLALIGAINWRSKNGSTRIVVVVPLARNSSMGMSQRRLYSIFKVVHHAIVVNLEVHFLTTMSRCSRCYLAHCYFNVGQPLSTRSLMGVNDERTKVQNYGEQRSPKFCYFLLSLGAYFITIRISWFDKSISPTATLISYWASSKWSQELETFGQSDSLIKL